VASLLPTIQQKYSAIQKQEFPFLLSSKMSAYAKLSNHNFEANMDKNTSYQMKPKVAAATVAYAVCLAIALIIGDLGITLDADTVQAVSGAIMLLVAYFVPEGSSS
jgi:hypothetical protein